MSTPIRPVTFKILPTLCFTISLHFHLNNGEQIFMWFTDNNYALFYTLNACNIPPIKYKTYMQSSCKNMTYLHITAKLAPFN